VFFVICVIEKVYHRVHQNVVSIEAQRNLVCLDLVLRLDSTILLRIKRLESADLTYGDTIRSSLATKRLVANPRSFGKQHVSWKSLWLSFSGREQTIMGGWGLFLHDSGHGFQLVLEMLWNGVRAVCILVQILNRRRKYGGAGPSVMSVGWVGL